MLKDGILRVGRLRFARVAESRVVESVDRARVDVSVVGVTAVVVEVAIVIVAETAAEIVPQRRQLSKVDATTGRTRYGRGLLRVAEVVRYRAMMR